MGDKVGQTEYGRQGLGGFEELSGGDGIVVVGINGHINEGFLEGIQ